MVNFRFAKKFDDARSNSRKKKFRGLARENWPFLAYILKFLEGKKGGNFGGFSIFGLKLSQFLVFRKTFEKPFIQAFFEKTRGISRKTAPFFEKQHHFSKNRASFSKNKLVFRKVPKSARARHFRF